MLDDVELRELRIFLAALAAAMRETRAQRPGAGVRAGCPLPWPASPPAAGASPPAASQAKAASLHRDQPAVLAGQQAHARGDLGRPGRQQRERKLAEHTSHHPHPARLIIAADITDRDAKAAREPPLGAASPVI